MMRTSESTNFVALAIASGSRKRRQRVDVQRRGFVCEQLRGEAAQIRHRVLGWPFYRTPGRGPDREGELFPPPVAIPDLPGNRSLLRLSQHPDLVPQRCEVRVASNVDRVLRARLHARVALPTKVGLD